MRVVTGDKELIRKLESLDKKVRRRVLRKANSKAIRIAVRAAKKEVRPVSNTIAKGLGVRHKSYQRGAVIASVVGVRNQGSVVKERPHITPYGTWTMRKHDPRNTAHLVEGGTKPHMITIFGKSVRHPGMKANPFLEPAMEKNEKPIINLHGRIMGDEITKAAVR